MPLFAALGLGLGQLGPLGWWPLEDPCWGLPRGDPQGESRMRVGCALGPLPPVLAPAPVLEELSIMKSSMQRGRWGAGAGPLGKCPICVAEHECVVPSGHCSQPAAGGAPTTPQVLVLPLLTQASLSLSLAYIHSCSSGITALWANPKFQPSS